MAYDAIVIGAGHNGLVSAAYLARAGLSVMVVERSGPYRWCMRHRGAVSRLPDLDRVLFAVVAPARDHLGARSRSGDQGQGSRGRSRRSPMGADSSCGRTRPSRHEAIAQDLADGRRCLPALRGAVRGSQSSVPAAAAVVPGNAQASAPGVPQLRGRESSSSEPSTARSPSCARSTSSPT